MFEKVTYSQYSDTLGRAVVPDEDTFNSYKLTNTQYMKRLLPYIEERDTDGIDNAVCMMIEVDYLADHKNKDAGSHAIASESVSGHSVSFVSSGDTKEAELNAKSIEEKKLDMIRLFCTICCGIGV